MKIDSLTKYDELVSSGIPEEQARALAHSFVEAGDLDMELIATKADIKHLDRTMYLFGILIFSCLGYLVFSIKG